MKQIDTQLASPQFMKDAEATRQMAAYTAKLEEILRYIVDNVGKIEVVASAPAATELDEIGDGKGNIISDVKILDNATEGNRKLYYKFKTNLRTISSA